MCWTTGASRNSWPPSRTSSAGRSTAFRRARVRAQPARTGRRISACMRRSSRACVWIGVALPVGRMTAAQMRGLAEHRPRARRRRYPPDGLAEPADLRRCRDDARRGRGAPAGDRTDGEGLSIRAGLVACTGNTGCKFAASNTKDTAMAIAAWVEARVALDTPDQRAPHRLPQLLRPALHRRHRPDRLPRAARPTATTRSRASTCTSAAASAPDAAIARELYRDVKVEDCPRPRSSACCEAYLANRAGRRRDVPALQPPHRHRRAQGHGRRAEAALHDDPGPRAPPALPLIPDGAPFSMEQRAWLNGFFAGLLSLDAKAGASPLTGELPDAAPRPWPATATTARRPGTTPPCRSTSACSWPKAARCRASCLPPWRSRIAASAAISARPTRRPSPPAPRPSSTSACPAARKRAAC